MTLVTKFYIGEIEPSSNNVGWFKPVEGGFALYLSYNGRWQPVKLMDDKGTGSAQDDTIADLNNIGTIVADEVNKQMDEIADSLPNIVDRISALEDTNVVKPESDNSGREISDIVI